MKKNTILILLFFVNFSIINAQNNFFKTAENSQLSKKKEVLSNIKKKRIYSLDEKAMRTYLRKAPVEFTNNGATIPLDIPLPDGTVETFNMVESPLLSPEVAAANPSIKTYLGTGTKDKKASISLSLTSVGFNAIILNVGNETVYFDSYSTEKNNIYFNYYIKDVEVPVGEKSKSCLVEPGDEVQIDDFKKKERNPLGAINKISSSSGTQLRTFRLAVAANGEFTRQYGSTTKAGGLAAVVAYVNRIRLVFRKELAVDFVLVSGENLIYTDPATDPFTDALPLDPIHSTINTVLGNGNASAGNSLYDIGHLFGFVSGSGNGLAGSRVCEASSKGRAYSLIGSVNSYSQDFMDNLILHEMGHQFAMSHSFNSTVNVCTSRNAATSVEPGSGATIMSYGFICGTDNAAGTPYNALLQYHSVNYEQAIAFINTKTCQVTTATGNSAPAITVPSGYTIPKSTPFILTGSATDVNSTDVLTYCWEGTDIGTVVPDATTLDDTAQPPFFRSYAPSTSPSRTYPSLEYILNGTNQDKGDKLPSIGIVTKHTLTVRDNKAAGGGVNNASVNVTIDGNIGPFLITSNTYPVINALSSVEVTWSVNGTNVATPTVNILFSIDGGLTFPRVLASGVPNDGSQFVTIPTIPNTVDTARFKVEAVGNIFFDISNTNIVIRQPMSVTFSGTNVTPAGGATGSVTAVVTGGRNTYNFSTVTNFTNGPYSIVNTLTTYSTINVPALPAGSILNSSTLTFVTFRANSPSWRFDVLASLTGTYNLADTRITSSRQTGLASTNPSINLTNFPLSGATISLRMFDDYDDVVGADATIASANVTLNYTRNGYTYLWSNGATTPTISSLVAGVYSVTVTDAFGNTTTGSYTVSNDYSITATSGANGTISPAGSATIASGGSRTYTFTPDSCYIIADVLVDGVSVGSASSYSFTNVTKNRTISVSFTSNSTVNTTTISACDSYVWNGTTYTTTGIYTGTTTNCVTQRLNLTINRTTWNGTSWNNGVPDSNTKAIISGNYSQASNVSACSLEVTGTAVVTVPTGFNFTISGKVTVAPTASLTFENNTNLIQLENIQNSGFITFNRNSNPLKRFDYTIWSSPVTNFDQFLTTFSPLTSTNRFYKYNEATNFYSAIVNPGTTSFDLGSGYLIRISNTHPDTPTIWTGSFTGIPNNGVVNKSISFSGSSLYGYNLVGNPYPSTIDAEAFITANASRIEGSLYFWRKVNAASGSAYAVYSRAGSTRTVSSDIPTGIIQVGQGFFVKAKSGANTITFTNSMRLPNNNNRFFKYEKEVHDRLWLNLSNASGAFSQLMIGYFAEATLGKDTFDAKYINDSPIAFTSILTNEEYSIQGRPKFTESDVVPLQFKTNIAGEYKISLDRVEGVFANGQDLFLVDNETGLVTNLKENPYSFASLAEIYTNRFSLKYQKSLNTDTNLASINDVKVYKKNEEIYIKSSIKIIEDVKVYDVLGRQLAHQKNVNSISSVVKNVKKTNQVLLIKIVLEGKIVVNKKIVN